MTQTLTQDVTICNQKGLHARASAALTREAQKFSSNVKVLHEGLEGDATSLMDLLMLGAYKGCIVQVKVTGDDAAEALKAIVNLIENRFGEDQ